MSGIVGPDIAKHVNALRLGLPGWWPAGPRSWPARARRRAAITLAPVGDDVGRHRRAGLGSGQHRAPVGRGHELLAGTPLPAATGLARAVVPAPGSACLVPAACPWPARVPAEARVPAALPVPVLAPAEALAPSPRPLQRRPRPRPTEQDR